MKKILTALLAACMVLSMVACGGGNNNSQPAPAPTPDAGSNSTGPAAPTGEKIQIGRASCRERV